VSLTPPPDKDIVIFGVSGDLSARKLLPALYNLSAEGLLPRQGDIVGVAPVGWSDGDLRDHARAAIREFSRTGLDESAFTSFARRLRFVRAGDDGSLAGLSEALTCQHRLAYLAVPSSAFATVIKALQVARLAAGTSVIIEKPFGHDLESARTLNVALHAVFPEERIFRIDHYLGKETVQNIMVLRFGNTVLERIWNRDCVAHVEITVAESLGVEHRGAFYEETGAIRDIVQNHLFQVLAMVAMDPPLGFDALSLRNEKIKVLRAVQPIRADQVVRGQYTAGEIDGKQVPGYREEPGVAPDSTTETYAALRLRIDSWRWARVPFTLRTGKRLRQRTSRVVVVYHDVPLHLFSGTGIESIDHNRLEIRIEPDEGIDFTFVAKRPGPDIETQTVSMNFDYDTSFKASPPEAYERLLHDALSGDHTLFIGEDEVERGWEIVDPVLRSPPPVVLYPAGSWGPVEADALAVHGRWHNPPGA
jgi:glucose-6-phosphate 1-dehydrogenase